MFSNESKEKLPNNTNTLLLDLDCEYGSKESKALKLVINDRLSLLCYWWKLKVIKKEYTKSSNGNIHCIIKFDKKIEPRAACFAQCYLGSDPKRELANWMRIMSGISDWNRLWIHKLSKRTH